MTRKVHRVNIRAARLLIVAAVCLLVTGCQGPGEEQLVFIEKTSGQSSSPVAEAEDLQPVVKDQVQLQESNLPSIKVCVLPFLNISGKEELDYYTFALREIFAENLNELARFANASIVNEDQYRDMLENMGYDNITTPDEQIVAYLRNTERAEYIIYGEISNNDENPMIQPYVIALDGTSGTFQRHKLEAMTLKLNNFLDINPFVMDVINNIDEMAESNS